MDAAAKKLQILKYYMPQTHLPPGTQDPICLLLLIYGGE